MSDIVFYYFADIEILNISDANERYNLVDYLNLELKLLILLIPVDGYIIFPPSHFLESPFLRDLTLRNLAFQNDGYIRLWMREGTTKLYREKKQKSYESLRHIDKYRRAYYLNTDYNLVKLPFKIETKNLFTGKESSEIWEDKIRKGGIRIGYPVSRLEEFLKRAKDIGEEPFVWETFLPILQKLDIKKEEAKNIDIRASISQSYLEAHKLHNIKLPSGSMIVRNVILPEETKNSCYDLLRFRRVLQLTEVLENISRFDAATILKLKFKSYHIINFIRVMLGEGYSSGQIIERLKRKKYSDDLKKMVKSLKVSSFENQREEDISLMMKRGNEKPQKVFVIHGRNEAARDSLFQFLRCIGLKPIEWSQAIIMTGKSAPFIGEVLNAAFSEAQAVVVLLTGDDEARLKVNLLKTDDPDYERNLTPQARPNVLFEAGMAFGTHDDRTILLGLGTIRPFSDVAGRHVIRLNNSAEKRKELAQRLGVAGCDIDISGTDWLKVGDFNL